MKPPPRPAPKPDGIVSELVRLLGPAVVLLKCTGKRPVAKGWQKLTTAAMTPEYLAGLTGANIGVNLGEPSGGLVVVDCDTEEFADAFRKANPELANTFQTRGARGRSYWLRLKGHCPPSCKLAASGEPVGEFRSTGNQSIAWGIHPDTGKPYQWVVTKPALAIAFDSLRWPDGLSIPLGQTSLGHVPLGRDSLGQDSLGQVPLRTCPINCISGAGVASAAPVACSVLADAAMREIGQAIQAGADSTRQNNAASFNAVLALIEIRNVESVKDMPVPEQDYFADAWFVKLKAQGRVRKPKAHYLRDIYDSIQNAKRYANMKTNDAVHKAWALAQANPMPPEAGRFEGDTITQNLIALGYQLHVLNEGRQWPLSRDKAGKVMRLTDAQIRRDLDDSFKVITSRIFEIAKPHEKGTRQATEYLYIEQSKATP